MGKSVKPQLRFLGYFVDKSPLFCYDGASLKRELQTAGPLEVLAKPRKADSMRTLLLSLLTLSLSTPALAEAPKPQAAVGGRISTDDFDESLQLFGDVHVLARPGTSLLDFYAIRALIGADRKFGVYTTVTAVGGVDGSYGATDPIMGLGLVLADSTERWSLGALGLYGTSGYSGIYAFDGRPVKWFSVGFHAEQSDYHVAAGPALAVHPDDHLSIAAESFISGDEHAIGRLTVHVSY